MQVAHVFQKKKKHNTFVSIPYFTPWYRLLHDLRRKQQNTARKPQKNEGNPKSDQKVTNSL